MFGGYGNNAITRPMRTNSRPVGVGKSINWDEVYD